MNTFFHIGWSKTGTTAFQKWLVKNSDQLLDSGIFFPETGRWKEGSHHELALSLRPIVGYRSSHDGLTLWKQLASEIAEAKKYRKISTVIITSELLPPIYEYPFVIRLFEEIGSRLSILAVVREQVDFIRSLQRQLVEDPIIHLTNTVTEVFRSEKKNYLYYEKLKKYKRSYPWEGFVVLPYSKRNIVEILAHAIGWQKPIDTSDRENVSSSSENVEVIRYINRINMPDDLRRAVNEQINNIFEEYPLKGSYSCDVDQNTIEKIRKYYRSSNEKLLKYFGVCLV